MMKLEKANKRKLDNPSTTPFSEDYIESCFLTWFNNGRPQIGKLVTMLPRDDLGRTVAKDTLARWMRDRAWNERADDLDSEVSRSVEQIAVQQKVEMFQRHALVGGEMIDKGIQYLREHGLDKSADAIKMIIEGVRIEKSSIGIPQALMEVSSMSDAKLMSVIARLMSGSDDIGVLEIKEADPDALVDGSIDATDIVSEGEDNE